MRAPHHLTPLGEQLLQQAETFLGAFRMPTFVVTPGSWPAARPETRNLFTVAEDARIVKAPDGREFIVELWAPPLTRASAWERLGCTIPGTVDYSAYPQSCSLA